WLWSGFTPAKVAPALDFLCVHIYPESGKLDGALHLLQQYAVGKPLVIEETFPLNCSAEELEKFLLASRKHACGWIGHYDGKTIADYEGKQPTLAEAIWLSWLKLFRKLTPIMLEQ
ncbi:MAG: hypothetical protein N3B01_08320, partial [Verrucomicrobiae bacterium]|nr:hypothetical protein [Verrucomicrobiae bacterium]